VNKPDFQFSFFKLTHLNQGAGHLNIDEFTSLYLEIVWVGFVNDTRKKNYLMLVSERFHSIPSVDDSKLVQGTNISKSYLKILH
jgi:hypothetical protein